MERSVMRGESERSEMRGESRDDLGRRPRISLRSIRATSAALLLLLLLASTAAHAAERPASFVDVATLVPGLVVEMRYAGAHNFVGAPVDGYERPVCLLTRQAAQRLAQVQRDLAARGLGLKVFDCYRPVRAVAHFMRWARDVRDTRTKAEFYPAVDKRELFRLGYISPQSGHSRGSTVDLGLVRLADGAAPGVEPDMGTPFDTFSPRSWPTDRSVSAEAQQNRALLADAMRRRGFARYVKEWWHFTLRDEPFPGTYFDFPVR
jgi:D-alanyl-D-alanine dipeptidase